ncbi:MAG: hypothetical protein QGH62_04540 [Nitrospinaceae bacterium]|nr:hypothetical protein [Nitrospinaceae bacterium]
MRRLFALSFLFVFGSVAYADYEVSDSEKERYLRWAKQLKSGRDFALAVAPNGCYDLASWNVGGGMYQAKREALARCEKKCKSSTCRIMDVNGTSAFIKQRGSPSSSSRASNVESFQLWGGTYTGEVVDSHPHGQGTLTLADGTKYIGEWKDSKFHGQGTLTAANGDKYVGEFTDGNLHGQGTFTWADGRKYVGEWKNDESWEGIEYTSFGKVGRTISSGNWCEGCTPNEKQLAIVRETNSGQIAATWEILQIWGGTYIGEVLDGHPHSQGTLTWADGTNYAGEWKDGKYYGRGTFTWSNGRKYVGEWKEDKAHGRGTYTGADGTMYVGEWKEDKQYGQGTYTGADGEKYVGKWKNGKYYGQGTFTWADETKYVGKWRDGKFNGQGTLTAANGDKYVGEFKDDKAHGQGTLTATNGDKYVGEFKDDKFWEGVEYLASGEIAGTYSDGKLCKDCKTIKKAPAAKKKTSDDEEGGGSK